MDSRRLSEAGDPRVQEEQFSHEAFTYETRLQDAHTKIAALQRVLDNKINILDSLKAQKSEMSSKVAELDALCRQKQQILLDLEKEQQNQAREQNRILEDMDTIGTVAKHQTLGRQQHTDFDEGHQTIGVFSEKAKFNALSRLLDEYLTEIRSLVSPELHGKLMLVAKKLERTLKYTGVWGLGFGVWGLGFG